MTDAASDRRTRILASALGVFREHGFTKTTMSDLAAAAGMSRQGLYLQFSDKQEVLLLSVRQELDRAFRAAQDALQGGGSISDRVARALDEWLGPGSGESASDLSIVGRENAAALAATFAESRAQFIGELAAAIRASSETVDDSRTVAETLHATATGWKYLSPDREGFREHVAEASAIILREAR